MPPLDLFTDIVETDKQHTNYRLITSGMCGPELEVIQSWSDGFIDRDGKFVQEFQTTFNSSFWELYLHATFRHLGVRLDFTHSSPDFVAHCGEQAFVAEATIASHPEGYTAEWERDVSPDSIQKLKPKEIVELATVRLANAIDGKWKKYRQQYSKLAHVRGKPFVICVAPFDQPFFFMQSDNALRRVLYGHDRLLYFDNQSTGDRVILGELRAENFAKPSGATVPIGFFRDNRMADVSAVIFSNTATFGKVRALSKDGAYPMLFTALRYNDYGLVPIQICAEKPDYEESLLDGLHVCLNPFATHPLDERIFEGHEVCVHRFDPAAELYLPSSPHGFLFQRSVMTFPPRDVAREARTRAPEAKPMIPWPTDEWPEGELVGITASVGPFTDHHMAHYRNWTILVVRDREDDDWSSQAIAASVDGLDEYIQLNSRTDVELLLSDQWCTTKQEAFDMIKAQIDTKLIALSGES